MFNPNCFSVDQNDPKIHDIGTGSCGYQQISQSVEIGVGIIPIQELASFESEKLSPREGGAVAARAGGGGGGIDAVGSTG